MAKLQLSQIEQEFIVFYALHQAIAQTAARIAQWFDSANAFNFAGEGVENPFGDVAKGAIESLPIIKQAIIDSMPNANQMLEFLRDNELRLSWEKK